MEKTVFIEGMSCNHCVNAVKESLKAIGIKAKVELDKKTAKFKNKNNVSDQDIIAAIESGGYKVKQII